MAGCGKGDVPRPCYISEEERAKRWAEAFGKKEENKEESRPVQRVSEQATNYTFATKE